MAKDLFSGIPDEMLPENTKRRFFCIFHQEDLGVICEVKRCKNCGWDPAVAKARARRIEQKILNGEIEVRDLRRGEWRYE